MASNKKLGNDFEREFCQLLHDNGFWVHNLAQNHAGQPADVIAVKNGNAHLIDCKVCTNGKFQFSRIEENQHYAMESWIRSGNFNAYFALKVNNEIYLISSTLIPILSRSMSCIDEDDIKIYGRLLAEWLRIWED